MRRIMMLVMLVPITETLIFHHRKDHKWGCDELKFNYSHQVINSTGCRWRRYRENDNIRVNRKGEMWNCGICKAKLGNPYRLLNVTKIALRFFALIMFVLLILSFPFEIESIASTSWFLQFDFGFFVAAYINYELAAKKKSNCFLTLFHSETFVETKANFQLNSFVERKQNKIK